MRTARWARGVRRSSRDLTAEFRRVFDEAVECRLLSDVPLGVFLSGGIDSSAIVAAIAHNNHQDVRTLTLHFTEEGYGEGPFAEQLAARYKTQHVTQPVTPMISWQRFDDALDAGDQPSIDGINTYTVCQLAKQSGLTVALCGHGGDELFGGYDNFRFIPQRPGIRRGAPAPRHLMGRAIRILAPDAGLDAESGVPADEPASACTRRIRWPGRVFWDDLRGRTCSTRPAEMVPAARSFIASARAAR